MGRTPDTLVDRSLPDTPQTVTPQRQTNNGGSYGEDLFPATTRVPVRAKSPQSPVTDDEAHRQGTVCRDWVRLGVEISALCVGLAGIYGLFVTFKETRKSTEAATRAAVAAEQAVIATADQVKIAQDTLQFTVENNRLDQRAWVSISHVIKLRTLEAEVPMMLGVTLTNSGKTPARRLVSRTACASAPGNKEFSPFYPSKEYEAPVILSPGGSIDAIDQAVRPQSEIDALKNGSRILYCFGKISYDDVFGRGYCYTYCSYLDRNLINMRHCRTYNNETNGRCEEQLNK